MDDMKTVCLHEQLLNGEPFASGYYRVQAPWMHCRQQLADLGIKLEHARGFELGNFPDVVVWHGPAWPQHVCYFDALKCLGSRKLAWSLDDDYWHPQEHDTNKPAVEAITSQLDWMRANADWIIVSTQALAESVGRPEKTIVLPNLVDPRTFRAIMRAPGPLRIVYPGSLIHSEDAKLLIDACQKIDAHWTFFGCPPPLNGVGFLQWTGLEKYHATLESLRPDIVVAPLLDTAFNRVKSNVKWLEATAVGAAFIGSREPAYKGVHDGVDGVLCHEDEWVEKLTQLAGDEKRRSELVLQARLRIVRAFSWGSPTARQRWIEAFKAMAS